MALMREWSSSMTVEKVRRRLGKRVVEVWRIGLDLRSEGRGPWGGGEAAE